VTIKHQREPGIYQIIARRGRQCGMTAYPPIRTGSGTTSATPASTAAEPKGT
jgi:hypothetical protein